MIDNHILLAAIGEIIDILTPFIVLFGGAIYIIIMIVIIQACHDAPTPKSKVEVRANNGDPQAQYYLGMGNAQINNFSEATYWLCVSENNGYDLATQALEQLIADGLLSEDDVLVQRTAMRMARGMTSNTMFYKPKGNSCVDGCIYLREVMDDELGYEVLVCDYYERRVFPISEEGCSEFRQ